MKRLLVAGIAAAVFCAAPAVAADMAMKAPPLPSAPSWSWTGCYVGGNVGGGWSHLSTFELANAAGPVNLPLGSQTGSGLAGGGQIGCDYQSSDKWVIGIRGMFDGASLRGNNLTGQFAAGDTLSSKVGSFGTAVVKAGYLLNPTFQLYGVGGVAWMHDNYSESDTPFGLFSNASTNRTGYDVGVGLSWMFAPHWDMFIEYDHMGFGTKGVTLISTSAACNGVAGSLCSLDNIKQNVDTVLVGLDYRFAIK